MTAVTPLNKFRRSVRMKLTVAQPHHA